jgi:hypothetical protein
LYGWGQAAGRAHQAERTINTTEAPLQRINISGFHHDAISRDWFFTIGIGEFFHLRNHLGGVSRDLFFHLRNHLGGISRDLFFHLRNHFGEFSTFGIVSVGFHEIKFSPFRVISGEFCLLIYYSLEPSLSLVQALSY